MGDKLRRQPVKVVALSTESYHSYRRVKNGFSSQGASIRHESELALHFREFLPEDPVLRWRVVAEASDGRPQVLEIELDGRRLSLLPIYALKPGLPWLESLRPEPSGRCLLVTPELTHRVLDYCKQHGIAAIDLNGRTWLRAPGLLVDRRSLPGRSFRSDLEPRNIFVGKSARIVRCLLTDRDRVWTQAEIVPRTQASSGLVSRIVQHLIAQGFLAKTSPREFRLRDPLALLDAWVKADRFAQRARTTLYAGHIGPPAELAQRLQEWAQRDSVSIAFTQWIAAWERHPFTEPVLTSAYVSRLPGTATLEQLGLRPVTEGGKLWLHLPDDDGVFTEKQTHQELTLATDAQIYLDLQGSGLRGPDAAAALREWEGFCRP